MDDVSTSALRELGSHLISLMPSVSKFQTQFPDHGEDLELPAMSLVSSEPQYTPCPAYLLSQSTVDVNNQVLAKYIVGQWEFPLIQIDIFCGSKKERSTVKQEFFEAITAQFPINGATLNLSRYYDVVCRYDFDGEQVQDNELSSSEKNWRMTLKVKAHCHAIKELTQYAIVNTELNVEPQE